jgi:hypothetical protein
MLTLTNLDQFVRQVGWANALVDKLVKKIVPTTFAAALCPDWWYRRDLIASQKMCFDTLHKCGDPITHNGCGTLHTYHYYYYDAPYECQDQRYTCFSPKRNCNYYDSECM